VRLTIYLAPDRGPISPVELDLLDIFRTMTPPGPGDGIDRGRLDLLCAAIRRRYDRVVPESNLPGLRRIYANFGHADRFDGAVLRVAGEIPAPPDAQLDEIRAEIGRLKSELVGERNRAGLQTVRAEQLAEELRAHQRALEAAELRARVLEADVTKARFERDRAAAASAQLEATLVERDRRIDELLAERRPHPPTDRSHPHLDS
jgi:hypothetical protein